MPPGPYTPIDPARAQRLGGAGCGAARPCRVTGVVAAAALLAALLGSCGSGEPGSAAAVGEAEAVRGFMADRYLYADRLPSPDLAAVGSAEQALAALRVEPPDRFSYVDRFATHQAFFDEGRAMGIGIGYVVTDDTIRVRFVQPQAPAASAGLQRGDVLLAIDGVPAASLVAAGAVVDAFGAAQAGVTLRFDVRRGSQQFPVTVTKDWYAVEPVLASRLIDHQGILVGYVLLYTFTEPARAAWHEALERLAAAGARSVVVDLRDNGGGRLFVAAAVAGSLAPAGNADATFAHLRHNDRHRRRDLHVPLPDSATAGLFERVVWITSGRTCSASEVLIAGLMPYRRDVRVGEATCGKPVGFNPYRIGDKVLSAVTFSAVNRDGFGDWFDGLQPTCRVDEVDPLLPYGDVADPRLAEALAVIASGHCATAPAAPTTKSIGRPAQPAAQARERGLASETGLR
jgi:carboxyl-terminal processing protease